MTRHGYGLLPSAETSSTSCPSLDVGSLPFLCSFFLWSSKKNQCWCWMIWIPRWYETCHSTSKGNVNSGSFSHVDLRSESLQTVPLTNKRQATWTLAWHIAFWNPITMSHSPQSRSEVASYSTSRFYLPSGFVIILLSPNLVHLVKLWVFPSTQ